MKIDDLDLKILTALQKDARMSLSEVSEAVNLSVSACHNRIKKLEKNKIIKGYKTIFNFEALLNYNTIYVNLRLGNHRAENFTRFETAIQSFPEIVECHAIGGGFDYLLKFICPSVESYQKKIQQLLDMPFDIIEYYTYIVTDIVKNTTLNIDSIRKFKPLSKSE